MGSIDLYADERTAVHADVADGLPLVALPYDSRRLGAAAQGTIVVRSLHLGVTGSWHKGADRIGLTG